MNKILKFISHFWKNNKSKITVTMAFLFAISSAFILGLHEGKKQFQINNLSLQLKESTKTLNHFITSTQQLINSANDASNKLAKQVIERKNDDEQSTQILLKLLASQSNSNGDCLFDDDIMHIIKQARNKAITATTNGFTSHSSNALRHSNNDEK